MKAMLFAAGLGTRLRPLTNDRPKALVEVAGKTLLEWNLRKLAAHGFTDIVVNVHAFADLLEEQLQLTCQRLRGEAEIFEPLNCIVSNERGQLLETGGGLRKAMAHFGEGPFLTHNVDIISDIDLTALIEHHQQHQHLATLCVSERVTSRYLLFDRGTGTLRGWKNVKTNAARPARAYEARDVQAYAFSGIAIYEPEIFEQMPIDGPDKFSIVDTWLSAARTESIRKYAHSAKNWIDVGRPAALASAEAFLNR